MQSSNRIVLAENLEYIRSLPAGIADLIYIDPPFNTGKRQQRTRLRTVHDEEGGDRKAPRPERGDSCPGAAGPVSAVR